MKKPADRRNAVCTGSRSSRNTATPTGTAPTRWRKRWKSPELKADIAFSRWCEDNGFGADVLDHRTRAAAIAMGREPEALCECLNATDRQSLRYIYENEFSRFTCAGKPTRRKQASVPLSRPTDIPA